MATPSTPLASQICRTLWPVNLATSVNIVLRAFMVSSAPWISSREPGLYTMSSASPALTSSQSSFIIAPLTAAGTLVLSVMADPPMFVSVGWRDLGAVEGGDLHEPPRPLFGDGRGRFRDGAHVRAG